MERGKLDTLVKKYLAAESNDDEDAMLKTKLLKESSPGTYSDLKALFAYFEMQKTYTTIPEFQNPAVKHPLQKSRIVPLRWIAAAASIAILVFAYVLYNQSGTVTSLDTYSDPEVAAQKAAEAVELLSGELNKGRTMALDQMKEFDNLDKYLKIF